VQDDLPSHHLDNTLGIYVESTQLDAAPMPPQHLLGYAQVSQQALQHRMLPGKAHGIVQIENFSSTFRRLKNPSRPVCITLGFKKVMGLLAISKPFNLSFFCVRPSPSQRLDLAHHPIHQKDFLQ
jgi:hypothetical protein